MIERVLTRSVFTATDKAGVEVVIDDAYVEKNIGDLARNADLSKFIL